MNYIKHLNTVFEKIAEDDRLNTSHVSLYMALFQQWNTNRFKNPISVTRNDMLRISKIGSKTTYLKCLHDLTKFGYITYHPSKNPLKGSLVDMTNFWPSSGQVVGQDKTNNWPSTGQVVVPSINIYKHNKHKERETGFIPPTLEALKFFIKKIIAEKRLNISSIQEAEKFYNHYQSNGWMVGKNPMQDWQAAATSWLLKSAEFSKPEKPLSGHLHTNQNKDYDQPL
ncbi:hypothetical protein [Fulvivirga sp.]|uniref:hypothetical protein n=1 Tax=Fulvivirga sp. TaxID=1931237 RepID=UPI0032EB5EA9